MPALCHAGASAIVDYAPSVAKKRMRPGHSCRTRRERYLLLADGRDDHLAGTGTGNPPRPPRACRRPRHDPTRPPGEDHVATDDPQRPRQDRRTGWSPPARLGTTIVETAEEAERSQSAGETMTSGDTAIVLITGVPASSVVPTDPRSAYGLISSSSAEEIDYSTPAPTARRLMIVPVDARLRSERRARLDRRQAHSARGRRPRRRTRGCAATPSPRRQLPGHGSRQVAGDDELPVERGEGGGRRLDQRHRNGPPAEVDGHLGMEEPLGDGVPTRRSRAVESNIDHPGPGRRLARHRFRASTVDREELRVRRARAAEKRGPRRRRAEPDRSRARWTTRHSWSKSGRVPGRGRAAANSRCTRRGPA